MKSRPCHWLLYFSQPQPGQKKMKSQEDTGEEEEEGEEDGSVREEGAGRDEAGRGEEEVDDLAEHEDWSLERRDIRAWLSLVEIYQDCALIG